MRSVAIVDYGLGNLFSVQHACEHVGLNAGCTSSAKELLAADAIILPGVGAFGDAMERLRELDLVPVLQDISVSTKPFVGICLGLQLLMTDSSEFGHHKGLGIIEGTVVRLSNPKEGERKLKVPQVGWNRIAKVDSWTDTPLEDVRDGEFMYFVHSFIAQPADSRVELSRTRYGQVEFCSSIRTRNIFACQYHPERSGNEGLKIYRKLKEM